MRLFLLFHDAALPHSRYLLEAFAAHPSVSHLTVGYPEGRGTDLIFSAGANTDFRQETPYQMVSLQSSRLRPKWVRWSAILTALRADQSDYVVVLDEALYPNTLIAGLAVRWLGLKAPTVFYGFENIAQTPPLAWLREKGVVALWPFLRKTLRYFLFDQLLQPIRKRFVAGGLVCYKECADIIIETGWRPLLAEQWWGVDTRLFRNAAENTSGHCSEWRTGPGQIVIGFVGRYVPEKGVVDLLRALQELGDRYVLVCIGGGPQETQILQIAAELDVSKQLRLMSPMPPGQLARHIAAMDMLVLPSHTDTFWKEQYGRVLVEAMAAAVPVIGSRSGAIPHVIGDDRCTFNEGNIAEICCAVKVAANLTIREKGVLQQRAQMGDVSTFVQAYMNLYQQLHAQDAV